MSRVPKMTTSDFYCTCCGNKGIPVMRAGNRFKEPGHLKKLFCITCKRETNHCEIKQSGKYNYQDFLFEFNNSNFDENGIRKQDINKLKQEKGIL